MAVDHNVTVGKSSAGAGLEIRGLSVCYGRVEVLKGASLSVREGEFFTLVGPSGSGKSSLLLCLAGFVAAATGSILLGGKDITSLAPNLRNIGMVFQSYTLFPHITVHENIAYGLRVRGKTRTAIEHRVAEMLRLLHLEGFQFRYPNELSGGQQQRVALARALAFSPGLLLLDEPLGAIDRKLKVELQSEIRRIQRATKTTLVYVTHDQKEAMAISDRIAVLRDGCILQTGTAREIYDDPSDAFVADFFGGANLLTVTILERSAGFCAVDLSGYRITGIPLPQSLSNTVKQGTVMIRPEHWSVSPSGSRHYDGLPVEITEIIFEGDTVSLDCKLRDERHIIVRKEASAVKEFQVGDTAHLGIEGQATRLFSEKDGS